MNRIVIKIKELTENNFFWAFIDSASLIIIQFFSLMVLSKILTPDEYGIIGMMTIFIAVGNVLVDSGLGGALIKKQKPTLVDYSTLFWYNIVVAAFIYILIIITSPKIAELYNTPNLSMYLRCYCSIILISAIDIVQRTILLKKLRFKILALTTLTSNLIAFVLAYLFAINGWGVWSLIIQQITFVAIKTVLHIIFVKNKLGLSFSWHSFKELFSFGGSILCANILSNIYGNIVSAIIPKMTSLADNGYYMQASKIKNVPLSLITSIIDKVLFPQYSKIINDNDRLDTNRFYVKKISIIVSLCILLLIVSSQLIVDLLLGDNWTKVGDYLRLLLLSSFGFCYISLLRNYIKSLGYSNLILKIELTHSILGILIIGIMSIWGVNFILYGFILSSIIMAIISSFFVDRKTLYKIRFQINDIKYAFFIYLLSYVVFFILIYA